MRLLARSFCWLALLSVPAPAPALDVGATLAATPNPIDVGRAIYREALLPSGAFVRGMRANGSVLNGREAACASCHRRSGLGGVEGLSVIPAIRSQRLYQAAAGRPAYDDVTLLRAITQGLDVTGRPLGALMPRYELSPFEGAALLQYLKEELSRPHTEGITSNVMHFATVVAPGVADSARHAMLEVLNAYVADRNIAPVIAPRRRAVMAQEELTWKTGYRWQLHVWALEGPAETWTAQLQQYYDRQPVFAVIGGLSVGTWTPVHVFCETTGLPCLFPTVDLPVVAERDFYSLYFSRGVLLEADVLARYLLERGSEDGRLVQVFRAAGAGEPPAQRLAEQLQRRGWTVEDRPIREAIAPTMATTSDGAALVLWLGEGDVRSLTSGDTSTWPDTLYVSATLLGDECVRLPEALVARAELIYPYEVRKNRGAAHATFHSWLVRHGIAQANERVQAQAYFAATAVADAMSRMAGIAAREDLVERLENMAGRTLAGLIYPRFGLGQGQRFASKGAYLARCASLADDPVAVTEWIVP